MKRLFSGVYIYKININHSVYSHKLFRFSTGNTRPSTPSSKKDDIFTISLIGRPNVGKSTLFNRLAGESLSLVDSTPGLTRDRKEAIIKLFGIKLRIVDTAGVEDLTPASQENDSSSKSNSMGNLVNKMITQTRHALIYSDLTFFMLDARDGVTFTDIKLANWLNSIRNHKENPQEIKFDEISSTDEFYEKLKILKENDDVSLISKIVLLANKVENNFVPSEVFSDFKKLNLGEPILISAEEGDNLHEVYEIIEKNIPLKFKDNYNEKIKKRIERYKDYKIKLRQEFIDNLPKDGNKYSISDWEKDFDYLNKLELEDNSDYDSDNEIDPLDTIIDVPSFIKNIGTGDTREDIKSTNSKNKNKIHQLKHFKRPIKIAVVGKQNVGKSSVINSLLKDDRVIISDIPGTTRDSIPIQWIYKGRRIELIDTAGLKPKNLVHDKIDKMASASTIKSIKYCHVVLYVIDSMEAFTATDMKLIEYIGEQGRAMIIISNKWDLVSNGYKTKAKKWIEDQFEKGCSQFKEIRINYVSAKSFFKIDTIMDDVLNAYSAWNVRISTYMLNQWVNQIKKVTNSPNKNGEYLKLKFMTQIKSRPPVFTVFVNNINIFFKSHDAFLKKMMIKEFNLRSAPIRFLLRDHKKISQSNEFKFNKVSIATAKIQKKLHLFKQKMAKPTYRKKVRGYDMMYGKKSIYRQMKK